MSYFREARGAPHFLDVLYEIEDGVARVTLNRPEAYNAYSTRSLEELATAFRRASWDDAVDVVVFTGAGDRAFCTGGDVKEYARDYIPRPRDYWKYMGMFRAYLESILHCAKPVIARLNGICVGGGNESQLACDLTVMGNHTYLGQVGTGVGSVACGGATQWLPLVVGDKRARQMLYLNERIPAHKALAWGLVNEVAVTVFRDGKPVESPTEEELKAAQKKERGYAIDLAPLDRAVRALADQLRDRFPECLRYTKAQTNFFKDLAWSQTVPHAQEWLSLHYACREPWEGMKAFVEKRPVDFRALRRRWVEDRSPEYLWGAPTVHCSACGARDLPSAFEFCGICGAGVRAADSAAPGKK